LSRPGKGLRPDAGKPFPIAVHAISLTEVREVRGTNRPSGGSRCVNTSWRSRSGGRSVILVALICRRWVAILIIFSTPIHDCGGRTITNTRWERGVLVGEWGGYVARESRQVEVAGAGEFVWGILKPHGFESEECVGEVPLDNRQACLLELNNRIKEVELILDSLSTVANTKILHSSISSVLFPRGRGICGKFARAVNACSFSWHRSEVG
jgi:hypothetical protein